MIGDIERKISYKFKDKNLLSTALTHSSYAGQFNMKSNERLEFIGDGFLDAVIGFDLFVRLTDNSEGTLSKRRAQIVCSESLAELGLKLGIDKEILLGNGEELNRGRCNKHIIADAVEAIIGAVYIDGGYEEAKGLILELFEDTIDRAVSGQLNFDYKSRLQELVQKKYGSTPIRYTVVSESGPEHCKSFSVQVEINDKIFGTGTGNTKKEAEKAAAKYALQKGEI